VAAAGNLLGGLFVVRRTWPRKFLHYFMALGAGYMLAVAFTDVIPESVRLGGQSAFLFVLIGYFLVHLFEHILAPHFHFGEETHTEMMRHHRARTILFGLGIHTFFDGVAIAAGFLVSTWLGAVIFFAIFLHKLPEGFTFASVVQAMEKPIAKAGCWSKTPLLHTLTFGSTGFTAVNRDQLRGTREEAIEGAARPGIRRGELVLKEGMGLEIEPNACLGMVRVNIGAGVLVTSRGAEELNSLATRVQHVR